MAAGPLPGTGHGVAPAPDPDGILMGSASAPSRTLTRFPSTFGVGGPVAARRTDTDPAMLDIAFIAAGLAFFGLAAGYAALCARL